MDENVNLDDFWEETVYVVNCPSCGAYIETMDNPIYEDSMFCTECNTTFGIVKD